MLSPDRSELDTSSFLGWLAYGLDVIAEAVTVFDKTHDRASKCSGHDAGHMVMGRRPNSKHVVCSFCWYSISRAEWPGNVKGGDLDVARILRRLEFNEPDA